MSMTKAQATAIEKVLRKIARHAMDHTTSELYKTSAISYTLQNIILDCKLDDEEAVLAAKIVNHHITALHNALGVDRFVRPTWTGDRLFITRLERLK